MRGATVRGSHGYKGHKVMQTDQPDAKCHFPHLLCTGHNRSGPVLSGCGYNTIPTLQEQAKASWSDVQNQYQRRADLIPNLVSTVQGYAAQEKNVLTSVIEARAKATQIKVDA